MGASPCAASSQTGVAGWLDVENEPRELIDAGEQVVVLVHGRFRLAEDSESFEGEYGHIWAIEGRKAVSCTAVDVDEAKELMGRR